VRKILINNFHPLFCCAVGKLIFLINFFIDDLTEIPGCNFSKIEEGKIAIIVSYYFKAISTLYFIHPYTGGI